MKIIINDSPQLEYEILCLLEYFAKGRDAGGASALQRKVEKLSVGMSRKQEGECFDGIQELYEETIAGKTSCDGIFAPVESLDLSPARLVWLSMEEDTALLTQIRRALSYKGMVKNGDDLIKALCATALTAEEKWSLMGAYSDYDNACRRVKAELATVKLRLRSHGITGMVKACVNSIKRKIEEQGEREFAKAFGVPGTGALVEVVPSVMGFDRVDVQYAADGRIVLRYGIVYDRLDTIGADTADGKEALLLAMKALADSSRLLIVGELSKASLYGQELCELTGLSPATVSHHMNELIRSGLVTPKKRGTKVIYMLQAAAGKQLIGQLSLLLHDKN